MLDITKDDFLENEKYLEAHKAPKKKNKLVDWISKNKFITIGTAIYVAIATINMFLVYYFFKLFSKI